MAEGKRPGGLTALAVLNFVFGGLGAIGVLALLALLNVAESIIDEAAKKAAVEASKAPGAVYLGLMLGLVNMALLIASGVGYLTQKKILGKMLGNAYGILALLGTVYGLTVLGGKFDISTIIGLVYPVLTLALLNTVFKDDFPN